MSILYIIEYQAVSRATLQRWALGWQRWSYRGYHSWAEANVVLTGELFPRVPLYLFRVRKIG